jgi:competence protein ComEA
MGGGASRWALAGAVALAAVAGLALVVVMVRETPAGAPIEVKLPDAPPRDGVLKVYVTGAVARPGVYEAREGDRYADALALAGGPTEDAEPLAVNMARRVRDEDHIHVPRQGEAQLVTSAGDPVLDLNTATLKQLEELPGIGPSRAQRIVESRTKDGAFTNPEDLVQRKIIPQSMLEPIRERIQVRP